MSLTLYSYGEKKKKNTGKYMKNSVKKWTSLLYVCISYSRNSMIVTLCEK